MYDISLTIFFINVVTAIDSIITTKVTGACSATSGTPSRKVCRYHQDKPAAKPMNTPAISLDKNPKISDFLNLKSLDKIDAMSIPEIKTNVVTNT
jgi:hypothetical protein